MLAVADGVGGWAEQNVDSSLYSQGLCKKLLTIITFSIEGTLNEKGEEILGDPKSILIAAVSKTTVTGSSTCCIASLSDVLHFANLGDSGFALLRHSNGSLETVLKSSEQCHGFNFPYQVGTGGDNPGAADGYKVPAECNDILIMGTDGLWDNVFVDDIKRQFKDMLMHGDPKRVSEAIANHAKEMAAKP